MFAARPVPSIVKGLLAVSVAAAGREPATRLRAIGILAGADDVTSVPAEDGWVALTGGDPDDQVDTEAGSLTVRLTRSLRAGEHDVATKDLGAWLHAPDTPNGSGLAGMLPPFAAAHREGRRQPLVVAGDWLGIRQLFWWQGKGVAAVATSARALAAFDDAPDRPAMAVQSLLGWQVGVATPYSGVTKLAPGSLTVLHNGRVRVVRYADPVVPAGDREPDAVVEDLAELLRGVHGAYLADHPDTVLQLSAGWDTRMLLAAIPPPLRAGLPAFTLDVRGGIESRIAGRLAREAGLDHRVHWLDAQPSLTPAAAHRAVLDAAAALDGMASALALAPLTVLEDGIAQGHRLSGTGGEAARGFYHPGQVGGVETTPRLVARLARWRLFANEAVAAEAFDPGFDRYPAALAAIGARFEEYSSDWLQATDDFYVYDRLHRWAGAHATVAGAARFSANPLLDRRFVELAFACRPEARRSSHLAGRLIRRLDRRLAEIPVDSGLVPARVEASGLGARMSVARVTARKAVRKVRQRLGHAGGAQFGAAELARLVVEHWRGEPDTVEPLRHCGVVSREWLDGLVAGRHGTTPATVAFLCNLLVR